MLNTGKCIFTILPVVICVLIYLSVRSSVGCLQYIIKIMLYVCLEICCMQIIYILILISATDNIYLGS